MEINKKGELVISRDELVEVLSCVGASFIKNYYKDYSITKKAKALDDMCVFLSGMENVLFERLDDLKADIEEVESKRESKSDAEV